MATDVLWTASGQFSHVGTASPSTLDTAIATIPSQQGIGFNPIFAASLVSNGAYAPGNYKIFFTPAGGATLEFVHFDSFPASGLPFGQFSSYFFHGTALAQGGTFGVRTLHPSTGDVKQGAVYAMLMRGPLGAGRVSLGVHAGTGGTDVTLPLEYENPNPYHAIAFYARRPNTGTAQVPSVGGTAGWEDVGGIVSARGEVASLHIYTPVVDPPLTLPLQIANGFCVAFCGGWAIASDTVDPDVRAPGGVRVQIFG